MKAYKALTLICAMVMVCLFGITPNRQSTFAQATTKAGNNQVRLLTNSVEVVEVIPSAEKCATQKGTSVRLRVTSETPVDVRLYVQVGYKKWLNRDFTNQKRGDEITDYMCDRKPNYKVYAHAAGSSEEWPKP